MNKIVNACWSFFELHFVALVFVFSILLPLSGCVVIEYFGSGLAFLDTFKTNTKDIYKVIASLSGTLLGFVLSSISIMLLVSQNPRFNLMRTNGTLQQVFDVFFLTFLALGGTVFCSFVGVVTADPLRTFITPRDWEGYFACVTAYASIIFMVGALSGVCLCIWVLRNVTTIASREDPA